jgi:hypothetical protein
MVVAGIAQTASANVAGSVDAHRAIKGREDSGRRAGSFGVGSVHRDPIIYILDMNASADLEAVFMRVREMVETTHYSPSTRAHLQLTGIPFLSILTEAMEPEPF